MHLQLGCDVCDSSDKEEIIRFSNTPATMSPENPGYKPTSKNFAYGAWSYVTNLFPAHWLWT